MILKENDIRLKLMMCEGSENYYTHPLFKNINFTDGIAKLVDLCGANWLLVDVLANLQLLKSKEDFICIKLLNSKEDKGCQLTFEDGNYNEIRKPIAYTFTDFPLYNWIPDAKRNKEEPAIMLFFRNDVLYLQSEH